MQVELSNDMIWNIYNVSFWRIKELEENEKIIKAMKIDETERAEMLETNAEIKAEAEEVNAMFLELYRKVLAQ